MKHDSSLVLDFYFSNFPSLPLGGDGRYQTKEFLTGCQSMVSRGLVGSGKRNSLDNQR